MGRRRGLPHGSAGRCAPAAQQRFISAAVELSLDYWYDEVSLRRLATKPGVSLQTVVNLFGTKESILTATIE